MFNKPKNKTDYDELLRTVLQIIIIMSLLGFILVSKMQ